MRRWASSDSAEIRRAAVSCIGETGSEGVREGARVGGLVGPSDGLPAAACC